MNCQESEIPNTSSHSLVQTLSTPGFDFWARENGLVLVEHFAEEGYETQLSTEETLMLHELLTNWKEDYMENLRK